MKKFLNYGLSILTILLFLLFMKTLNSYIEIIFVLVFIIRIITFLFFKDERDYKISIETVLLINAGLLLITFQKFYLFSILPYSESSGEVIFLTITLVVLLFSIQIMIAYFKRKLIKERFGLINIISNLDRLYKVLIAGSILTIINLNFVQNYLRDRFLFNVSYIEIIPNLLLLLYIVKIISEFYLLGDEVEQISKGNFGRKITSKNKIFDSFVNSINNISVGMKDAVEERVKSERLKTDLITNVSHDLKTPLTSIINYVKLLKKEEFEDKKIKNYINVIDKKSERLKTLTEDLIEAAKITSGNETPNLEERNIVQLILQANGEFAEKFNKLNLEIITNVPKEEIIILMDSKKMWRVIENIYENILKYSLKNTRVYVDLKVIDDDVIFSIKNISKDKLNIDPSELMERFVRGDSSRNTSGSGLGLSIARNLTEFQYGKFNIEIDGDLFQIKITFKILNKDKK